MLAVTKGTCCKQNVVCLNPCLNMIICLVFMSFLLHVTLEIVTNHHELHSLYVKSWCAYLGCCDFQHVCSPILL